MTLKEAVNILERHNKWRRSDDKILPANPTRLGIAIDTIVAHFK